VLLSKNNYNETAWHKAAKYGKVEVFEKLWDWAKELQLKPNELRNEVLLLKISIMKQPGPKQQKKFASKY
jgi:hypothetical protein